MSHRTAVFIPLTLLLAAAGAFAEDVDFNRDVRPILSDKCFFCHGPDRNTQEADLRLDSREAAADVLESGELVRRVLSDDPDERMPPVDSKLSLSARDKRVLQEWVKQGAVYKQHWAFELLPESVSVPKSDDSRWPRQTLDRFVLAKIQDAGLNPNPEAAPLRWLRRVTLDLTGLSPTTEQIGRFQQRLSDSQTDREAVYQTTVDELLQSPAFGEHMAVAWLDAARYADSYGYQSDKLNTQWPYRDWVVEAFNNNLPYDDFLTWQLAGDLLNEPTRDQLVATAFNRIHRLNNEGGAVFEEWRIENVADRVHTFGTAILGLTMECSRCHDHKYDPITMRDYYSLSAFFNSIDESGVYDRTQKVPCPSLLLPTAEQQAALESAKRRLVDAESAWSQQKDVANQRYAAWKKQTARSETPEPTALAAGRQSRPDASADGSLQEPEIPDLRLALGFDRPFDNSLKSIYHPSQSDRGRAPMVELVDVTHSSVAPLKHQDAADKAEGGENRLALKLDGERGVTTHGIEPFDRWTPFTVVVSLRETKRVAERSLIAHHTRGTDCGYNGWDLTIVDGHLESRMYRVWPGNAIGVRTVEPVPQDQWHQVAASYDGSSRASGLKLYLNGRPLPATILRDSVKKSANVKVDHGGEFVVGQRFRARGLDGGLIDDVRAYTRDLTESELRFLATGRPGKSSLEYFTSAIDEDCRSARQALTAARQAVVMAEEAMNEIPIMREMDEPRPAHLLARGRYDAPTDDSTLVKRDVLSGLSIPFPKDAPRDRLGLAKWVTDPRHPLTARVSVNRLWSNFFAEPLVRTPENFGSQGALPTRPGLLDWLARDFINSGWDVKRFCRNIVLSATYRQDSATTRELLKKDPTNRLLARGPAYRLSAEQIRDVALAASGLLNRERGGPPVSPYQPGGDLWRESNGMSPAYQQSVGQSLYRRSLYSVWKRTVPLPNMMAFDATPREVCTVKRARTNTPLQALVLLNDVQFIEACRALAERSIRSAAGDEPRVAAAFQALTGRTPDEAEQSTLVRLLGEERAWFSDHKDDAEKLIAHGESKTTSETDPIELAAMTTVCQAILNLDATVWKR